jgi:hypothetical protein
VLAGQASLAAHAAAIGVETDSTSRSALHSSDCSRDCTRCSASIYNGHFSCWSSDGGRCEQDLCAECSSECTVESLASGLCGQLGHVPRLSYSVGEDFVADISELLHKHAPEVRDQ